MKRGLAIIVSLVLALAMLPAGAVAPQRYSMSFFGAFDTIITVMGFAASEEVFEQEAAKAQEQFHYLNRLFDKYNDYPGVVNVRTLNSQAGIAPVKVEQPLFDLLAYAKDMYGKTNGLVNIAFGAVLELWHDSRETANETPEGAAPPAMEALEAANKHTNINDLVLDVETLTVFFKDPQLKLDVGAIAKGFAVEAVAENMLAGAMPSFIINAGGNVRTGHSPMDGRKHWGVSIQDPDKVVLGDADTDILEVLFVSDVSVVTSGDYQRFFTYEGERYHHIISPETLMPPRFFRSVTAVTEHSGLADWLSTALFLMEQEEGQRFVEAMDGVEALWILNDRSIVMTEGLKAHARSEGASNPR